ncbi:RND family transporter [Pseudothauera nasutitermitis]|uniref:RND family transporter n=1 Tax=Pseudothauera nasutitermitis TaxID=2565930 RepID=A0A4S4AST2_9RHOO|nr:efflux RND transporter permease subunit [Pseudothauera nasutitermitis]THF62914.1 RND family transporter [Pseudothauera nasutitermitis]
MKANRLVQAFGHVLFRQRKLFLALFVLLTVLLGWSASNLKVDAGFEKMIPLEHPYMKTFMDYRSTFGGANRVLVVLRQKQGDIYTPEFFSALKGLTDDVFFLPGVDRATVTSLFTPNVRYIEVVEEGFAGGNVIPADFAGTPEDLVQVRENVLKSGRLGRLVANDHSAALISAELLEIDPTTGARLDYLAVADLLEELRARYEQAGFEVNIIGFAKAVGDITDGARGVLVFFAVTIVVTGLLLYAYVGSARLAGLGVLCALVPVVWQLGILPLVGFGIDPMSILVPFLIFSIGISHAVQMVNAWKIEAEHGADGLTAANNAFLKLFLPGATALTTTALGFLVILFIDIAMVQELALTAAIGVALIIVTNKMLLSVLLTWVPAEAVRSARPRASGEWLWQRLKHFAEPRRAVWVLAGAALLLSVAALQARSVQTGDLGDGIPELHDDSRYNRDTAAIVGSFSIGVDVLSVIAQTHGVDGACTDFEIMDTLDRFETQMRNTYGVQGVLSLPGMAKVVNAGWNEGNPRWRVLSRDPSVLAQSVTPIDTSTGLLNTDCSAMQILIFTRDHEGRTIAHIVEEVKKFADANRSERLDFLLASGNVGVMAATNEAVDAAELKILVLLLLSIGLVCYLEFRSHTATLCIVLPLSLVAVTCNALMATLGIGLKVPTLPVIALGVGIGVDYGIYLYERMQHQLRRGGSLVNAYLEALRQRGTATLFTAVAMSIGVGSWAFSALKFQADMGVLLAFAFLANMLAAVLLLPALASILLVSQDRRRLAAMKRLDARKFKRTIKTNV